MPEAGLGGVSFVTCAVGSEPVAEEHEDERDIQGENNIKIISGFYLDLIILHRGVEFCSVEIPFFPLFFVRNVSFLFGTLFVCVYFRVRA